MPLFEKSEPIEESTLRATYKRSSYCSTGACVEVIRLENGDVSLRDSKNPTKEALRFTTEEWSAFLKGVKAGEFEVSSQV